MKDFDFEAGEVVLIDKPRTWTSFDVVNKLRYALKVKKVGHAGTLDPLATGLLVLCTGKFTKKIDEIQATEKEYTGTFVLGQTTPSLDLETEATEPTPTDHISEEMIRETAGKFIGKQDQRPPLFSAVNINGKRAYTLARKGVEMEVPPKQIEIFDFEITRVALPEVDFRVVVSKGTYIRSLARDFALQLNTVGYLAKLVRTRVGPYQLTDALSLEQALEIARNYREQKLNSAQDPQP